MEVEEEMVTGKCRLLREAMGRPTRASTWTTERVDFLSGGLSLHLPLSQCKLLLV